MWSTKDSSILLERDVPKLRFAVQLLRARRKTLREQFDAVYLAIGAQKPKELRIPGVELRGVFDALPFLIQKNVEEAREEPTIASSKARRFLLSRDDTLLGRKWRYR